MLTARRLGKRYGEKRVLRGIDLALPRGGFLVVTGPNGSGKTTLLHEPELVLLDEPFNALDAEGTELVARELEELNRTGTLVVASHEPGRLESLATARLALA